MNAGSSKTTGIFVFRFVRAATAYDVFRLRDSFAFPAVPGATIYCGPLSKA